MRKVKKSERETNFAEFPWMVTILDKTIPDKERSFIAAGSLIAPNIVLTLATPFKNRNVSHLLVVAGEWDLDSDMEIMPHANRSVVSIDKHEYFDSLLYNVALLNLDVEFGQQPNIGTVCLPTPLAEFDNKLCLSAVWSPYKGRPRKIYVKPESSKECARRLPKDYKEAGGSIDPSFSCAPFQDEGHDLNSGAALVCPMLGDAQRYTLAGIIVGKTDTEYIYVNMTHFMPWIFNKLGPRGTPLNHYLPFN